jgi:hypothetical protein
MNQDIPAPKLGALQRDPQTDNGGFLKSGSNDFNYISVVYGYP